jgi:hypothetical protein
MTCPSCQKEPLTRNRFIWKPQALTLTCSQCGAKLRMAPATVSTALALVLGLSIIIGLLALVALRLHFEDLVVHPKPGVIIVAILFAVALCVGGAIVARCILWGKSYIADARDVS